MNLTESPWIVHFSKHFPDHTPFFFSADVCIQLFRCMILHLFFSSSVNYVEKKCYAENTWPIDEMKSIDHKPCISFKPITLTKSWYTPRYLNTFTSHKFINIVPNFSNDLISKTIHKHIFFIAPWTKQKNWSIFVYIWLCNIFVALLNFIVDVNPSNIFNRKLNTKLMKKHLKYIDW